MYITLNDQNIYYQKVGRGKDLVLVHGWGQDSSTWWGVLDQLKEDFTVWILDLPGFGRSDLPKRAFFVSDFADIVEKFIRENKINKPHLLGHSLGGAVSIKLVSRNPELVDKLILESSSGIRPKRTFVQKLTQIIVKTFGAFLPESFGIRERIRIKLYKGLESDYYHSGEMKATLTNILSDDISADFPKVKNETLMIWGENDRSVRLSLGKKMFQKIRNSRMEVLEDVKHWPHQEKPELFLHYVKDFLLSS